MHLVLIILIFGAELFAKPILFIDIPAQVSSISTPTHDTAFLLGGGMRFGGTVYEFNRWQLGGDIKLASLYGGRGGTQDVFVKEIFIDIEPRIFIGPLFAGINWGFLPFAFVSYANRIAVSHTHVFNDDAVHGRLLTQGGMGLGSFIYLFPFFMRVDTSIVYGHLGLGFQSHLALGINLPTQWL